MLFRTIIFRVFVPIFVLGFLLSEVQFYQNEMTVFCDGMRPCQENGVVMGWGKYALIKSIVLALSIFVAGVSWLKSNRIESKH